MPDGIKPKNNVNEQDQSQSSNIFQEIGEIFTSTFETPETTSQSNVNNENRLSSLKSQAKDQRQQFEYNAVSLTFLEGTFEGQAVDLGVGIFEASHNQSAEWNEKNEDHIRNGASFGKLGARDFSIKAEYYSISEDVSQLVENLSHLIELQQTSESEGVSPPKLLLKQGTLKATTVVATSISSKYDYPLPKDKGFRHATVDIKLKLIGGVGSQYATGKPLSPTPLNDYVQSISEEERSDNAFEQKSQALLADCLSEDQSNEIEELIDDGKQQDPDRLMELDSETLTQLAFSGIIQKETIQENPDLQEKIERDLAKVIAAKGVNVGKLDAQFAESLINGSPSGAISNSYSQSYEKMQPQYDQLKEAVINQNLESVYNSSSLSDSAKTMERLFGCGLSIRQTGGLQLNNSTPKSQNREKLSNLNSYLAKISQGEIDEEELENKLNISNASVRETIIDNAPYQTKQDFLENSTGLSEKQVAYQIWETFKIEFNDEN